MAQRRRGGRAQPCFPGPSLGLATSLHRLDAGHQLPGSHTPEGASWEWTLILSNLCSLAVLRVRAVRGPGGACHQDTAEGLTMFSSRPLPPSPPPHRCPGTLRTPAHQGDLVCVECGKCFHQSSHLRAHTRAHTGTCPGGPGGRQSLFSTVGGRFRFRPGEVRGQAFSPGMTL